MAKENKQEKRFYTKGWVMFASYLGGPFAGCYLVGQNFETLGRYEEAQKVYRAGIITTILFPIGILLIPTSILNAIPNVTIPVTYSVLIYIYLIQSQGEIIEEHLRQGGKTRSGWRVAGIALLSFLVTFAYDFGIWLIVNWFYQTYGII